MDTATVVLPPIDDKFSVPSISFKTVSISFKSSASIPMSSDEIISSTSPIILSTPPAGKATTSRAPVLAPLGAAALPKPFHVITSTSTVAFPLPSKIFLTRTSSIILSTKTPLLGKNSGLIRVIWILIT